MLQFSNSCKNARKTKSAKLIRPFFLENINEIYTQNNTELNKQMNGSTRDLRIGRLHSNRISN